MQPVPKIRFRDKQIEMAHGAGGKASRRLVEGLFVPLLGEPSGGPLGDAAHIRMNGTRLAITTDSFVEKPMRFPGGTIGELAVNGTVNDLAVSGARAETLVDTYILEAGLPTVVLELVGRAMAAAARRAGVVIAIASTNGRTERVSEQTSASKSSSPRANRIVMPWSPIGPERRIRSPGRTDCGEISTPSMSRPIPQLLMYM